MSYKFGQATHKTLVRNFIDKDLLLERVSEEDVFELVFGYQPEEFEYVTSPFRKDEKPGCWFEYFDGRLRFIDYADNRTINGVRMNNIDCFSAVKVYYNLPDFYSTLKYIKDVLLMGKSLNLLPMKVQKTSKINSVGKTKGRLDIYTQPRRLLSADKEFWSPYGITRENLIEDQVFPISSFRAIRKNKPEKRVIVNDLGYVYTGFKDNHKKIYQPNSVKHRFFTNCSQNDIGGLDDLVPFGRQLIISKSYKDQRVLKNQGLNVVWFQNEGCVPHEDILYPLCKRFLSVVVFYDNDNAGITASRKISSIINKELESRSRPLSLPPRLLDKNVTDPSDLIKEEGKVSLNQFLKEQRLT